MSKSKEEIEKMQKKEEKKNEEIQKLNGGNINLFKKLVTQKITMESEDEDDEKKDKINCGKINQNKLISNNENIKKENKKENNEEKKEKKTESIFSPLTNEEKKEKKTEPLFSPFTSYTQSIFDIKTINNNSTNLIGNINNNTISSIFGNINNNNSTSIFGNSKSLFEHLNNSNSTSIFGNSHLFNSNNKNNEKKEENKESLFNNLFKEGDSFKFTGNLFSNTEKPQLTFSDFKSINSFFNESNNKKEENEEEKNENELFNEEDDEMPKKEKPKPLVSQDFSNYEKKYNSYIENFYVFSRITKKYVSKGNGFLSLEISKDKNNKRGVIVFRNQGGYKLVEGFIISNISKIESEEKHYKTIATIWYIYFNELGNIQLGTAKIPFSNNYEFIKFKNSFEECIEYVKGK